MTTSEPLILGIETSCDETGVGIVRGHTLLADAIASSVEAHARFGGVVPEVASRAHLEALVPTMHRALTTAGVTLADIYTADDRYIAGPLPGVAGAWVLSGCCVGGLSISPALGEAPRTGWSRGVGLRTSAGPDVLCDGQVGCGTRPGLLRAAAFRP